MEEEEEEEEEREREEREREKESRLTHWEQSLGRSPLFIED